MIQGAHPAFLKMNTMKPKNISPLKKLSAASIRRQSVAPELSFGRPNRNKASNRQEYYLSSGIEESLDLSASNGKKSVFSKK